MRLFMSLTSPYARMARVVLREKGLHEQVEEVVVDPYGDPDALLAANPSGLVPALTRDDGPNIIDSRLICAWLDHLPSDAPALLPEGGPARLSARIGEAMGQQLTDMSVAMVMERRRPVAVQHPPFLERRRTQTLRLAGVLWDQVPEDERAGDPAATTSLGCIAMACALGHVAFRHADLDWRGPNPALASWFDAYSQRPAMRDTAPPAV